MNQLSKNLYCIQMRSGVFIWLERERCENLMLALENPNCPKFVRVDDQMINTADVSGIFTAGTMEDTTLRKNGKWQCDKGSWHSRQDKCECTKQGYSEAQEEHFRNYEYYPTN